MMLPEERNVEDYIRELESNVDKEVCKGDRNTQE